MKKIIKFFIIALILGIIIGFGVLAKYTYDNYILPGKVVAHNKINIDNEFTLEFERFIPKEVHLTEKQFKVLNHELSKSCTPMKQLAFSASCLDQKTKTKYTFPYAVNFDHKTKTFVQFKLSESNESKNKAKEMLDLQSCHPEVRELNLSSDALLNTLCTTNKPLPTNCYDSVLAINTLEGNVVPGKLNIPRSNFDVIDLKNGKKLIIGGINCKREPLDSIELYDPLAGKTSLAYKMIVSRELPTSILLSNDKLLITGGIQQFKDNINLDRNTAEVLDLKTGKSIQTNDFYNQHLALWQDQHYHLHKLKEDNVLLVGEIISIFNAKKLKFFPLDDQTTNTELPLKRYETFWSYKMNDNSVLIFWGNDSCSYHNDGNPIHYYESITIKPVINSNPK